MKRLLRDLKRKFPKFYFEYETSEHFGPRIYVCEFKNSPYIIYSMSTRKSKLAISLKYLRKMYRKRKM